LFQPASIWLAVLVVCISCGVSASAQTVAERVRLFSSGHATAFEVAPWNMTAAKREGGLRERGACWWFNTDFRAKPWAGVRFRPQKAPTVTVTEDWIEKGFIRFHLNVTVDRYGNIGGGDRFQILPVTKPANLKYQAVRSRFIDRGRGLDEDTGTWQEVLVPLRYFTQLKPGHVIRGLNLQTRGQVRRVFSLDDVEYVRFETLPDWVKAQRNADVRQDWVEWPAYEALPEVVKTDKHPIAVRDGAFVRPDGRRAFMLSPYCREDSLLAYGIRASGEVPPTYDLYNREKHGWIYDEVPSTEALCRLGFNTFSVTPDRAPWWDRVGYGNRDADAADRFLSRLAGRVTLPYYVDLVCWPWTLGKPALNVRETDLAPDVATKGRHHWTPYRIIGAGRKTWLDLWTFNARRYRDAGARTLVVELMNEPAYMGETADHYAEFERWLRARYGSVDAVNRTWGTDYATLADAAVYRFSYRDRPPAGQRLDYDAYLSERFTEMIAEGVEAVTGILPDALVGVQTMRGFLRTPEEAVWKHRIARHETVVLTPTGGGAWTRGTTASRPADTVTDHPMAEAPFENDLLLAVAGDKMIVDNETYLRGQTRLDTRNRLWEHVVCGLDGLTVFSWSKRGWSWWRGRDAVQIDADKFPYSSLIPLARRTDALRGILDFSIEVQRLAPKILPKPWGPKPAVGYVHSWANARRRVVEADLYDKGPAYYAALRYSHWNMAMMPGDRIVAEGVPAHVDVLVAAGITHVERDLPGPLRRFVERGGVLILGECDFTRDVHDRPLPTESRLAPVEMVERVDGESVIQIGGAAEARLPGRIGVRRLQKTTVRPGAETVLTASRGRPVVTRTSLGKGAVYHQAADVSGYALAKILDIILAHAAGGEVPARWRALRITEDGGRLAPNVLASRRSHPDYHAVLLHNRDGYERTVRVAIPGLDGTWRVREALAASEPRAVEGKELSTSGIEVRLGPAGPVVLLVERAGGRTGSARSREETR
jgi:hypothetical protein